MKNLFYISCAILSHVSLNAQNMDSLFYVGMDTSGLSKQIALDEAAYYLMDSAIEADFSKIDDHALSVRNKYISVKRLSRDLTAPFETDEEKVRAIFIWMVSHIVYDYVELENGKDHSGHKVNYNSKTSVTLLNAKWEKMYLKYAKQVLRKERGICEGYSTLFYELCKYNNIPCEMVTGYAEKDLEKVNIYKKREYFPLNHAWNKVQLNGEWYYIDVTWASTGMYNGKYTAPTGYYAYYYLTPENKLFIDHLIKKRIYLVGNY